MDKQQKIQRELIEKHIGGWHLDVMRNASIEHFYKTGKASGSFLLALQNMMNEYKDLLIHNKTDD